MAKIASSTRVRRRLHAVPVALGLIALLIAVLVDHRMAASSVDAKPNAINLSNSASLSTSINAMPESRPLAGTNE